MRGRERIKPLLTRLGCAWSVHPDLRLGQLIDNACTKYGADQFNIEDHELLVLIERMLYDEEV